MSTDTDAPKYQKSALEFKSSSFSTPVLVISNADLNQIEYQLDEKIAQAPEFFKNSPLLIDLQESNAKEQDIDLVSLVKFLRNKKLIPIGIRGGNDKQNTQALQLNIAANSFKSAPASKVSDDHKLADSALNKQENEEKQNLESKAAIPENTLIAVPIRSGQRIYCTGDLIIVSHVSAGAEIMAEGNIHVYGSLRGRALAGVQGNINSRIFCSDLQAELISIAGHYKISEELDKAEYRNPTQIYLQEQTLIIKNL